MLLVYDFVYRRACMPLLMMLVLIVLFVVCWLFVVGRCLRCALFVVGCVLLLGVVCVC